MDDPAKFLEAQMAETNEVLALRAAVKEGQRLLKTALEQRNVARGELSEMRSVLRSIRNSWAARFLPRWIVAYLRRNAR